MTFLSTGTLSNEYEDSPRLSGISPATSWRLLLAKHDAEHSVPL